MSQLIQDFNPNLASSGTLLTNVVNKCGAVVLYNESNCILQLRFEDGRQSILTAWTQDKFMLPDQSLNIEWKVLATLGSASAPSSTVYGVAYEFYEVPKGNYPLSLLRQTNVGNQVTTNNTPNGTAFPTGAAIGDTFLRTDRLLLYFYDGTRWLTINEYTLPWSRIDAIYGLQPFSTSPVTPFEGVVNDRYDIFVTRVIQMVRVESGLNDAANYWNILTRLGRVVDTIDIHTWDSRTFVVGAANYLDVDINTQYEGRTIRMRLAKTGSPGPITLDSSVLFRFVG